jgi:hypothetical protein
MRAYHGTVELTGGDSEIEDKPSASFLTLTSHGRLDAPRTVAVFGDAWNRLRGRAARRAPNGQYYLIPERHLDGRLHVHAIETYNLGSRFWKDAAASCGLGYIAEEEEVRSARKAAWYASKYLAKSIEVIEWPKGFRRVRTSRGWPKLPELPPPLGWTFKPLPHGTRWQDDIAHWSRLDYTVIVTGHAEAWEIINPCDLTEESK